jgi:thiamine biosynthesis protein ThiS
MTLSINGESRDFPDGLTVASLVAHLGMKADRVAVELNLEIVPRANWDATSLKGGDKLEIVHFVGGGSDLPTGEVGTVRTEDNEEEEGSEKGAAPSPSTLGVWICPNCGDPSTAKFCSRCGEKKFSPADLSLRRLLEHAVEVLFHADSKIFRTFRVLVARPGLLTVEYSVGRRKPYMHPFQVFFVANLVYFLIQPVIGWSGLKTPLFGYQHWMFYSGWATRMAAQQAAMKGISIAELSARFDHVIDIQSRSLVLVMVPLFAAALLVLEWRPKRYLSEHLVFSLHYLAAFLVVLMIGLSGIFAAAGRVCLLWGTSPRFLQSDAVISVLGAIVLGMHLFIALRRFYHDSAFAAATKAFALLGATYCILQAYRIVLFLSALYTA